MTNTSNAQSQIAANTSTPDATFALITDEKLLQMYAELLKCTLLQLRARELFQEGKLESDLHDSSGREASAVSVCIDLLPGDALSIVSGDWLPAFAKGASIRTLLRVSKVDSEDELPPASRLLLTEGKNILVAADSSEQAKLVARHIHQDRPRNQHDVTAVFLPPGWDSLAEWERIMVASAERKLPVLFVDHISGDGTWAGPARKQSSRASQALFKGIPAIAVDAVDPVALYRVSYEAIVRARDRRGATFIQCIDIRQNGAGDTSSAPNPSLNVDPVIALERFLKSKGIEPEQQKREILADFHRELESATRFLDC